MNAAVAVVAAQMNAQHGNNHSAQQQQSPQGGYLAPYGYNPYDQPPAMTGQRSDKDNNGTMNHEGPPTSQDGYSSAYDMSQPKHAHTNHSIGGATTPPDAGIHSRYSYGYTTTTTPNNNNGPSTPIKNEQLDRNSPHSPYNQMYSSNGTGLTPDGKPDLSGKHSMNYGGQYGAYAGVAAMATQQYQTGQPMEPSTGSAAIESAHIEQSSRPEDTATNNEEEAAYIDVSQAHL